MNKKDEADFYWMQEAIALAKRAEALGEVPVGAVLIYQNAVVGEGYNQPIRQHDPSAHAEIMALRQAGQNLGNYRMLGATLYVTLEPCMMCVGAIVQARIQRLVFAALDPKGGAVVSCLQALTMPHLNHSVTWVGEIMATECGKLLSDFFKQRR